MISALHAPNAEAICPKQRMPFHMSAQQNSQTGLLAANAPPIARRKALLGVTGSLLPVALLKTSGIAHAAEESPKVAQSPTASDITNIQESYNQYAETYDDLDGGVVAEALGFPDQRRDLLREASGDVLECGVGTGLNLQFYNPSNLRSFTAIDLSSGMLTQAQRKATTLHLPPGALQFSQADVAELPFPNNSFDSVIDTFSMCVFPDPAAALQSMARVVRPGGKVLLLEHSRSTSPLLGWYQDFTAAPVAALGKGCVWNQDIVKLVESAGLKIVRVEPHLGDFVLSITATKE